MQKKHANLITQDNLILKNVHILNELEMYQLNCIQKKFK